MNAAARSAAILLLRGVAWVFFALAGLAFWFGGRAISEFGKTDRLLAEMEGLALILLFMGLGAIAEMAKNRLEEGEGPTSLSEALRK